MEDKISLRDRIETLEYLHDLLGSPAQEERRNNIRVMIEAYRAQEKIKLGGYPYKRTTCIPPAL